MAEVKPREFLYVDSSSLIFVGKEDKVTAKACNRTSQVIKLTNGRDRNRRKPALRNRSRIPLYFLNGGLGVGV